MAETVSAMTVDGRALYAKISWRLIPYIFLLYIVAYLDRVNVRFARPWVRRGPAGLRLSRCSGRSGDSWARM
jgi:hypothetical protein